MEQSTKKPKENKKKTNKSTSEDTSANFSNSLNKLTERFIQSLLIEVAQVSPVKDL